MKTPFPHLNPVSQKGAGQVNGKPMRAFPHNVLQYEEGHGMTLRDYFAAQLACGDAACGDGWDIDHESDGGQRCLVSRAKFYYAVADAMLEARKK